MNKYRISLVLGCLVFLIPINIYVIGDWLGTGVQWALFRYQQTYLGNSLILVTRDITYVLNGTMSGRTAISIIIWTIGVLLFIIAAILLIHANTTKDPSMIKKASLLILTGGIAIAIAIIVQYGILLTSQSGFSIPVGIPVILIIGWWMYRGMNGPEDRDDEPEEVKSSGAE